MRKLLSTELVIGLVVGIVFASLFSCALFEKYEVKTIDDRFSWRGEVKSDAPIVLVGVTDQCLQEFQWPINRGTYADIIEKLFSWGATSVCLDVFLDVEGEGAEALVKTVEKHDKVVLPIVLGKVNNIDSLEVEIRDSTVQETGSIENNFLDEDVLDIEKLKQLNAAVKQTAQPTENEILGIFKTYQKLADAAKFQAYINVGWKEDLNHDGVIRKIPLQKAVNKEIFYALSLVGAATHQGQTVKTEDDEIFMGYRPIPLWTDFMGRKILLVNYLTGKTKFESFSFPFRSLRELNSYTGEKWSLFEGKMVIIGPAYGQTDYYSGPFKPVRGMEIHALISAALMTENHITRLPIPVSFCLIVICSVLAAGCLKISSRWTSYGLVAGTLGGIVVVSQMLFNQGNVIIELIPTFTGAAATALIVKFYQLYLKLFLSNRALTTENRRLTTLYGISKDLASTVITERKCRLNLLLNRTIAGGKADGGFLLLYDPLTEELVSELIQHGGDRDESDGDETAPLIIPAGDGVLGKAVLTGKGAVFQHHDLEDRVVDYISRFCKREISSLVSVPMLLGDRRPVGSINLYRVSGSPSFFKDDLALVESVASQAGGVIENARLYHLATVDGLTGLYVHRHFQIRLEEELRRAVRYDSQLSLMMTDIDHFKKFNDTYGHQIGDYVLKGVANILRDAVRDIDVPARYGGEEFSVILPETDLDGAFTLAERLRSNVETHTFTPPGHELHVTISIGVSNYPTAGAKEKNKLIEYADTALYQAKNTGRNRTLRYSPEEAT